MPIRLSDIVQLRAFSRVDGLWLALYWVLCFALTVASPQGFLGSLLTIATPAFMYWRLSVFRDRIAGGQLSFRRALYYCAVMASHAICVFALVQFVYFKFIDGGRFAAQMVAVAQAMAEAYSAKGTDVSQLVEGTKVLQRATPVELVLAFMMQNFMLSVPLCLIVAIWGKRKRSRNFPESGNMAKKSDNQQQ